MEIENRKIPPEVRYFIVAQAAAGFKQTEIVDLVSQNFPTTVTQSAVSKILSKYDEERKVQDRPRSGRPKKLSEEQELAIIEVVENDRLLNATRVSQDQNLNPPGPSHVSARTITRTLNDHGLIDSTELVEQFKVHAIEQRLTFALECQQNHFKWERVIFTHESDLFPDKQGKLHYRRYQGESRFRLGSYESLGQ